MSVDAAASGWVVAGALLVMSGAALVVRARTNASGALFAGAGAALVVVGSADDDLASYARIAAVALLTAAIVTYPRLTWDLARILTLGGLLVGTALLGWLPGSDGVMSDGDLTRLAFALATVGGAHLWWQLETAGPETRSSLLWVLSTTAVTVFLVGVVTLAGRPPGLTTFVHASLGLIGVAAVLGVDRDHDLDGRWLASRAATWFFSVACAFAVATLILTLATWRSGSAPGVVATTVAVVVCGTLWSPLVAVVQRVSDGVLFGFRPDALTAAQRVAVGIGDDPAAAVRAIQEGLVLPYVALALADEEPIQVGVPTAHRRVFSLELEGEHVGDLLVGIRPGDLGLSHDDERVLTLAIPLLVQTIKARSLATNLQRARMASASVREEERRRLRRDLHDGLGPRLTGIAFTADAARLAATKETADPLLDRIRQEAREALEEIRELVYGLRPPALDELGLLGAIKLRAAGIDGVHTQVDASTLPALPAAVEVAAYRIVMEALTNVARHSGATRATVTVRAGDDVVAVSITDDGSAGAEWVPGIGLTSMRERASELGGTVTYGRTPAGSTVSAILPLQPGPARTSRDLDGVERPR